MGTALAGGSHTDPTCGLPAPGSYLGWVVAKRTSGEAVHNMNWKQPSRHDPVHAFPVDPRALATAWQRPVQVPGHLFPKAVARFGPPPSMIACLGFPHLHDVGVKAPVAGVAEPVPGECLGRVVTKTVHLACSEPVREGPRAQVIDVEAMTAT